MASQGSAAVWTDDLGRPGTLARLQGELAPRYDVGEEVGRGGMGRVLRAYDRDLRRDVALKVLPRGSSRKRALRLVEEAQVSCQLEHPSVLPVHDVGIDGSGAVFFTMQLIPEHETLRDVIERLRGGDPKAFAEFTFERRVRIIQQVCHALDYAHTRGVVHRDIKPENIVLGRHGEVWLVDWGVARVRGDEGTAGEEPAPEEAVTTSAQAGALTAEDGGWVGTPRYMAPEQILGKNEEVDHRSDLYAVSAVLYEFLSLRHYLGERCERMHELISGVVYGRVEDAENHWHPRNGRVPRHLSRFCRKGLAKDPEERWQSALDLERALQSWLEGTTPAVCPGTAIQRGLVGLIRWIDARPVLGPAILIAGGIAGLLWLVAATYLAARA